LTSDNQLLQLAAASGDCRGLFAGLQQLAPGFHAGEITGLATCARRPVVATAGADRMLRIWNWQDKSAELVGGLLAGLGKVFWWGEVVGLWREEMYSRIFG
jgi:hypothetical protein